jgi:hypothetical protein
LLVAEHDGYRRLSAPVLHRRQFELERTTGAFRIIDELEGDGEHDVAIYFHFAAGSVVNCTEGSIEIDADGHAVSLHLEGPGDAPRIEQGWVSESYGQREQAPVLIRRWRGTLPARFSHTFVATGTDTYRLGSARREVVV